MDKLIIVNRTELSMLRVLPYVMTVVERGRVLMGNGKTEYCSTSFKDGLRIIPVVNPKSDKLIVTGELE